MIKLRIQRHHEDPEMVEIRAIRDPKTKFSTTMVWGMVHADMIVDDELLSQRIHEGESIDVFLVPDTKAEDGGP